MSIKEDNVKLCNCARCNREILSPGMRGRRMPPKYEYTPYIYGLIWESQTFNHGRPYCRRCFLIEAPNSRRNLTYTDSITDLN